MAGSSAPRPGTDRAMSVPLPARLGSTPAAPAPPLVRRAIGRLASGAAELATAVLLTLLFFGCFLLLLAVAFPEGESLRSLALDGRRPIDGSGEAVLRRAEALAARQNEVIASLDVLRPDVNRRASWTIAWAPARNGEPLRDRDAIQTGPDGRALVQFDHKNQLRLEENSFVVVTRSALTASAVSAASSQPLQREIDREPELAQGRRRVVLIEGEMTADLQPHDSTRIEFVMPNLVASLADMTSRLPARFRVTVRKDHSATVAVLGGHLQLESRSGAITLGPQQYSSVNAQGDVSPPLSLAAAPALLAPAEDAAYAFVDLPPRITFAWRHVEAANNYRLRVARDAMFKDVLLDELVSADAMTWGRARPGVYWWQVAGVAQGVEGLAAPARRVRVQEDALPPSLSLNPPPAVVRTPLLLLSGQADPRARVYVMGRAAGVDDNGRFEIEIHLQPGANVLVVEAVDHEGRTSYWSQVVALKP